MPFGAGRRACSGSHFALLEAMVALAVVIREFHISSDQPRLRLTTPFTLHVKPPLVAHVRRQAP
jgi:cytochrome P450